MLISGKNVNELCVNWIKFNLLFGKGDEKFGTAISIKRKRVLGKLIRVAKFFFFFYEIVKKLWIRMNFLEYLFRFFRFRIFDVARKFFHVQMASQRIGENEAIRSTRAKKKGLMKN